MIELIANEPSRAENSRLRAKNVAAGTFVTTGTQFALWLPIEKTLSLTTGDLRQDRPPEVTMGNSGG